MEQVSPDKYASIENPAVRYKLAAQKTGMLAGGANILSQTKSENVQAARYNAQLEAEAREKARERAKNVANEYYQEKNEVGGWNFFDWQGNKISPAEYSRVKGIPLTKALEGSNDPGDVEFMNTVYVLQKNAQQGGAEMNVSDSMKQLYQKYPHIFGIGQEIPAEAINNLDAFAAQQQQSDDGTIMGLYTARVDSLIDAYLGGGDANPVIQKINGFNVTPQFKQFLIDYTNNYFKTATKKAQLKGTAGGGKLNLENIVNKYSANPNQ